MFKFLKTFFNDEKTIVGLCSFELEKPYRTDMKENFFNNFQIKKDFSSKFDKNILLF